MIKDILRAIRDEGILNKSAIANKVGIEESTLEGVLSLLASKGYLKSIDYPQDMPSACLGCPMNKECAPKTSMGSVYIITKKGKNCLENQIFGAKELNIYNNA